MQVVNGVTPVILNMPAKGWEDHAHIEPGYLHARYICIDVAQYRLLQYRHHVQVPTTLSILLSDQVFVQKDEDYATELSFPLQHWGLNLGPHKIGHYILSLFYFWFWDRVLLSCTSRPWVCNPLASISWVAGIIGLNYQTQHFFCFIYFVCVHVVYWVYVFVGAHVWSYTWKSEVSSSITLHFNF